MIAYAKTKPARDGLKAQKTEKARSTYRERYESDFIIADAAARYFRAHGVSKLPSHKALQAEIEQLTAEKNAHYNEYREKKARVKELHTVKSNLSQILQGEKDREKTHEQERLKPPQTIPKRGCTRLQAELPGDYRPLPPVFSKRWKHREDTANGR